MIRPVLVYELGNKTLTSDLHNPRSTDMGDARACAALARERGAVNVRIEFDDETGVVVARYAI